MSTAGVRRTLGCHGDASSHAPHARHGQRAGGFSIKSQPLRACGVGGRGGGRAYNPCMFNALNLLLGSAAIERATLLANHVLASESVATQRLRAHAGRCMQLQFDGWPAMLPPLPTTAFRVTPAGLVEWCGADALPSPPWTMKHF